MCKTGAIGTWQVRCNQGKATEKSWETPSEKLPTRRRFFQQVINHFLIIFLELIVYKKS